MGLMWAPPFFLVLAAVLAGTYSDCGDSVTRRLCAQGGGRAAAEHPSFMPGGILQELRESLHLCASEWRKRADAMQLLPAGYRKRRGRRELSHQLEETFRGSSPHSVFYFITSFSEPGQHVPQFSYVGRVDYQEFVFYDASTKRYHPKVPWLSKVENYDHHYWLRNSWRVQDYEQRFQEHLETLAEHYNQSGGVHTLQLTYGCEMRKNGSKGGYWKYAYDGKDFISFDKETLTWTAANAPAQNIKRKWDADSRDNNYKKNYLEEICIERLQKYLEYGKEMLRRTETPEVRVTRKEDHDGMETLICHVRGFYPKDIDIDWTRDGEVWPQDVFHGLVFPNSDGTYYTWRNITVDPKERKRYKCHVEHDGLRKPVDVAWKEPPLKLGLIIGCVVEFLLLLTAGIAVYFIKRRRDFGRTSRRQDKYNAASGRDQQNTSSEEENDQISNVSVEESDEGFSSTREATEKGSHNSEERVSLCPPGSSVSIEKVLYTSGSSGSSLTACEEVSHNSEELTLHEKDPHNSEECTSLRPSGSSNNIEIEATSVLKENKFRRRRVVLWHRAEVLSWYRWSGVQAVLGDVH